MSHYKSTGHTEFSESVWSSLNNANFDALKHFCSACLPANLAEKQWGNIHNWCRKEIGEGNYTWAGTRFYFKHERDAIVFTLRWL